MRTACAFANGSWRLVIDLLSQLPTRRFTRTLMSDKALLVKARMVPLYTAPNGRLYAQLVDLFTFYQYFEIDDHTGAALSDEDSRVRALRPLAYSCNGWRSSTSQS